MHLEKNKNISVHTISAETVDNIHNQYKETNSSEI